MEEDEEAAVATIFANNGGPIEINYRESGSPTLSMTGSHDLLVPKQNSEILHEAIAHSELVEIAETGHIFFAERPEASSRALLDFLAKHPIAAAD